MAKKSDEECPLMGNKVFVLFVGPCLLAICSSKEEAYKRMLEDMRREFKEEEIEKLVKEYGEEGILERYAYTLLEWEVNGEYKVVSGGERSEGKD